MCRVQPSLRARGWPARGEPHDRPREQEFRCGSPRGCASRPHPRLVSGALGSLELLLPSPVAAHGAERTQPPSGTSFLGDVRGWGALGFICITQTARGGRPDGCHRGNRAGSGAWVRPSRGLSPRARMAGHATWGRFPPLSGPPLPRGGCGTSGSPRPPFSSVRGSARLAGVAEGRGAPHPHPPWAGRLAGLFL